MTKKAMKRRIKHLELAMDELIDFVYDTDDDIRRVVNTKINDLREELTTNGPSTYIKAVCDPRTNNLIYFSDFSDANSGSIAVVPKGCLIQ